MNIATDLCPCGSGKEKQACCIRLHQGDKAQTADELMRSRFMAYALKDEDYLLNTWYAETRPEGLDLERDQTHWFKLEIIKSQQGEKNDDTGVVEFIATFSNDNKIGQLHEVSHFVKQDGLWYYKDGELKPSNSKIKLGRNDPCPCGSGKKYKRCCGR